MEINLPTGVTRATTALTSVVISSLTPMRFGFTHLRRTN